MGNGPEKAFDDADDRPTIADLAPRLADIEQTLASQEQSLQQLGERTSDETSWNRWLMDALTAGLNDAFDDGFDNRFSTIVSTIVWTLSNKQIDSLAAEVNGTTELANDLESIVSELQNSVAEGERQRERSFCTNRSGSRRAA